MASESDAMPIGNYNAGDQLNKAMTPHEQSGRGVMERVYTGYFGLKGTPFSITPDPEFMFFSRTHQNALEKIHYAIACRMGFMVLTGEVGTGKTTLCRALLDQLGENVRTVYVINPSLSGREILSSILGDLGVSCRADASKKELIDQLNSVLLQHGTAVPVVIIIDDAQTMPPDTLEDLRLLSNLETDKNKLLQILVVGQPELLESLDRPELRQLKQRVSVNCFLDHLNRNEIRGYIEQRLFVVGNQGQVRFSVDAIKHIQSLSGGVPRLINKLCDFSLTAAYNDNSTVIRKRHVRMAGRELIDLRGRPAGPLADNGSRRNWLRWPAYAFVLATAVVAGFAARPYLHLFEPLLKREPTAVSAKVQEESEAPIADNAAAVPAKISVSHFASGAYVLQLGSFKTLETTQRAIAIYARKGIEAHWNSIDLGENGIWYRVFTGRFATRRTAADFQHSKDLPQARILLAPWAVLIGPAQQDLPRSYLQTRNYDSYSVSDAHGRLQLCVGAFVTREGAELMAEQIGLETGELVGIADFGELADALDADKNGDDEGNHS